MSQANYIPPHPPRENKVRYHRHIENGAVLRSVETTPRVMDANVWVEITAREFYARRKVSLRISLDAKNALSAWDERTGVVVAE